MSWLAYDIGGANIKVADGLGYAESVPFPLWNRPNDLTEELSIRLRSAPPAERVAVTMTGELADCFSTKTQGVTAILDAVEQAAEGRSVWVYLTDGQIVRPEDARQHALKAAASNWHALAAFVARYVGLRPALLLDCGSTTVDVIPVVSGQPATVGTTDSERLVAGELVYTGVVRSPVSAVVSQLTWRGERCPVAQEVFATTLDAYLVLGDMLEDATSTDTADGRPQTRCHAHARLARMVCADSSEVTEEELGRMAESVREAQLQLLSTAYRKVVGRMDSPPERIVISGAGEFLLRHLLDQVEYSGSRFSLTEELGNDLSRAATAHALAVLARERLPA